MRRSEARAVASVVDVSGAHRSFGDVVAVAGVDVSVGPGEIVALLGPNGAGKTTLIEMLLGLLRPDGGTVSLFSRPPQHAMSTGQVGAMLQRSGLPSYLTVGEVVDLVRSLCPRPLPRDVALELANVGDLVDRRASRLSGGQSQRVRFALALVTDPSLLVLDEPTTAMDLDSRDRFWRAVHAWVRADRTLLFSTHVLEEADIHANRFIVLGEGRVILDGTANQVKALVGTRTIRCRLGGPADVRELEAMTGVLEASMSDGAVTLRCNDSDAALRQLLATWPDAHDIEIATARLEEAFRELTAGRPPSEASA